MSFDLHIVLVLLPMTKHNCDVLEACMSVTIENKFLKSFKPGNVHNSHSISVCFEVTSTIIYDGCIRVFDIAEQMQDMIAFMAFFEQSDIIQMLRHNVVLVSW